MLRAESYNNLPSVEESDKELTKRQNFDEFLKSLCFNARELPVASISSFEADYLDHSVARMLDPT
ncbi:16418_t:CDS:2, partial [Funneliformis geosporum]